MNESGISLWVIYDHPFDFPQAFVARRYVIDRPTADIIQGHTLEAVREKLPAGLARIERDPKDDPKIVEMWL